MGNSWMSPCLCCQQGEASPRSKSGASLRASPLVWTVKGKSLIF